jgi:protein-disulfide isomerase
MNLATGLVVIGALSLVGLRWYEWGAARTARVAGMTRPLPDWKIYDVGELRFGDDSASVLIVEFADFDCPVCRKAHQTMKEIERRYPGRVRTVFRHFPLSIHPRARLLASFAQCASSPPVLSVMRDTLFSLAPGVGRSDLVRALAESSNSDTSTISRCVDDPKTLAAISRDSIAGVALGVRGTPTFIVNSTVVSGFPGATEFVQLVEKEISKRIRGA